MVLTINTKLEFQTEIVHIKLLEITSNRSVSYAVRVEESELLTLTPYASLEEAEVAYTRVYLEASLVSDASLSLSYELEEFADKLCSADSYQKAKEAEKSYKSCQDTYMFFQRNFPAETFERLQEAFQDY